MHALIETRRAAKAIPLIAVTKATLRATAAKLGKSATNWIAANGFDASPGTFCLLPDAQGNARRGPHSLTDAAEIEADQRRGL